MPLTKYIWVSMLPRRNGNDSLLLFFNFFTFVHLFSNISRNFVCSYTFFFFHKNVGRGWVGSLTSGSLAWPIALQSVSLLSLPHPSHWRHTESGHVHWGLSSPTECPSLGNPYLHFIWLIHSPARTQLWCNCLGVSSLSCPVWHQTPVLCALITAGPILVSTWHSHVKTVLIRSQQCPAWMRDYGHGVQLKTSLDPKVNSGLLSSGHLWHLPSGFSSTRTNWSRLKSYRKYRKETYGQMVAVLLQRLTEAWA